jgi:hypothetical protein
LRLDTHALFLHNSCVSLAIPLKENRW